MLGKPVQVSVCRAGGELLGRPKAADQQGPQELAGSRVEAPLRESSTKDE